MLTGGNVADFGRRAGHSVVAAAAAAAAADIFVQRQMRHILRRQPPPKGAAPQFPTKVLEMADRQPRLWRFFQALIDQQLTPRAPRMTTPSWIKTPLLPHQQATLAAAIALEKGKTDGIDVGSTGDAYARMYTSYGILGDRVGSGKSLTALSLVRVPPPPAEYIDFQVRNANLHDGRAVGILRRRNQLRTSAGISLRHIPSSLFIIPHALMGQWKTYVTRDTELSALFLKCKADTMAPDVLDRAEHVDAVFVSSSMWPIFKRAHPLRTTLWNRIFVDEADSIPITTDDNELNALFYWFITASWMNLVFATGLFVNADSVVGPGIADTIPPAVLAQIRSYQVQRYISIVGCKSINLVRRMCATSLQTLCTMHESARLVLHANDALLEESYAAPRVIHTTVECATPTNLRILDSFVNAEVLEQLHAGDVLGAMTSLGIAAKDADTLVESITESLEADLEQARRTLDYKRGMEYSTPALKEHAIAKCEQRIASIQSRISAIQDRIRHAGEQTCPICFSEAETPTLIPCCKQVFCLTCICESLKHVAACPLCRSRIEDIKQLEVVGGDAAAAPAVGGAGGPAPPLRPLSKKDACIQFLKNTPDAKTLLFSNYDASFASLTDALLREGIPFASVAGSQARIAKILDEFAEGKYRVLFLNARNMGAGLNIVCATHVVLFHRLALELETQILGRALRLGRTEPLNVVHLLHQNERREP